ncbi:MAG: hypothetical protein HRT58_11855 [Crocinitomicaceae bacterium]|nr:hypothetical protein [Crocinitomicaceae bacterium]
MINKSTLSIVVVFLGLVVLYSCKKHRLKNEKAILEGTWEWSFSIRNYGMTTPPFITWTDTIFPSDVSSSYGVTFLKKGKIQLFENNELKDEYRTVFPIFESEAGTDCLIYNNPYRFEIDLDNASDHTMAGCVNSDTLVLHRHVFPFPSVTYSGSTEFYINFFKKVE